MIWLERADYITCAGPGRRRCTGGLRVLALPCRAAHLQVSSPSTLPHYCCCRCCCCRCISNKFQLCHKPLISKWKSQYLNIPSSGRFCNHTWIVWFQCSFAGWSTQRSTSSFSAGTLRKTKMFLTEKKIWSPGRGNLLFFQLELMWKYLGFTVLVPTTQQILERGRTTKTTMEWTMRTVSLTGTSGRLQLAYLR